MPGRYTLTATRQAIEDRFNIEMPIDWKPRFNMAPSQFLPIITNENPTKATMARWGLVPSWSGIQDTGKKMINARSETVATKQAFKTLFKTRRCLIPADGYFEWLELPSIKQPYFIHLPEKSLFAFAGLWDTWIDKNDGSELITFTLITCEPNELIRPIHNRMGVILNRENEQRWLEQPNKSLFAQYPADQMTAYMVSNLCNSPKNDSPDCLLPEQRLL